MTKALDDVLAANRTYVEGFGDKGSLALPPARRFVILTCMDARLDPAKFAGLAEDEPTSSAMLAVGPAMMPYARSLSRTCCSAPKSGS
jgi:hypothetical protein